ncbi:RdgB/HAM1 family non-canonical purine NTP pyrophosphatase [Marinimicrobium sp. ARAG 43.8]|uniref:RdgB/HAM1 family non-canonical purine NTP pyrophosphatase n=1 Tax=Marinimicrobium sp. ARAG 43.8 TaxID=3418719 RepID=UPI003CF8297F
MQTLVLASGNAGKLREFQQLLVDCGFNVQAQSDFDVTSAEETGLTFVENAILKARHASAATGYPALADDSGLAVDALDGRPGIYSARYAGPDASDADNNTKLLRELEGIPDAERGACYHCVLVLVRHADDPTPLIAQGEWRGRIRTAPAGHGGFGYDPLFQVPERECSAAELSKQEKAAISHRALATERLMQQLGAR